MDRIFEQAFGGKILSKISQRQIVSRQFRLPIRIVLEWVAINGFVLAAMHGEGGLAVSVKIQLAQKDAALDGFFEYTGSHRVSVPQDFARQSNIYRDYFAHGILACACTASTVLLQYTRGLMARSSACLLPRDLCRIAAASRMPFAFLSPSCIHVRALRSPHLPIPRAFYVDGALAK